MKIKIFGLMLLAVVMVFALASCGGGGGGNTTQYTITFDSGVEAITVDEGAVATAPAAPTKDGYNFAGWMNGEYAWNWDDVVTSDLNLTASWTPVEYALTLDLAGGVLANAPTNYTIEGLQLSAPSREGYAFLGWVDGNNNPVSSIAAGTKGALTLTATWREKGDVDLDFETGDLILHYAEAPGSMIDQNLGQNKATAAPDGYLQATFTNPISFTTDNPALFEFMKNAKNWHTIETEGSNHFFRVAIDSAATAKYEKIAEGQDYNVGVFAFTQGALNSKGYNCFTVSFDIRLAEAGKFGLNVYARDGGKPKENHQNGDDRVNLLTIDGDGKLWLNSDTIKTNRNCYHNFVSYIAPEEIGAITIGQWNTIKFVMTTATGAGESGYYVDIYCNDQKVAEDLYLWDNVHRWADAGEDNFDRLMIFGGAAAGVEAVNAVAGGYSNTYDFDNFFIKGSVVQ